MDYTGKIISKNPPQPTQASASGVWTLDEAAAAVRNNNWPIVGVPNPISKSLRFNAADSAYLNRTPASAGNRKTWTWSGWVKRSKLSGSFYFFCGNSAASNAGFFGINFEGNDRIEITGWITVWRSTSAQYRDPSAWYHIVVALDTTQATADNRVRLYVNGSEVTAFATKNNPTQNDDLGVNTAAAHYISSYDGTNSDFDGYLTEVNFIDGQALTPSSFGQTNPNTGVWEPIRYTGTYGTNGFYLNFKDSSSISALGYDYSGNGNNWTPNNFSVTAGAGNDSLTDVPTSWTAYTVDNVDSGGVVRGNYCTLNPLKQTGATLTNGNLQFTKAAGSGATQFTIHSTLFVSTGKWYFEVTPTSVAAGFDVIGVVGPEVALATYSSIGAMTGNIWGYRNDATKINNASSASYGNTWTSNDVIGVAIDMDNSKIWFSKNGTWQASGDPAAGTNAAYTNLTGSVAPLLIDQGSGTFDGSLNAGQRPFAYNPPTGFKSLCTTNLPTPVIGATSTTQADDYFNTILYTGNNTTQTVTVGFQPDLVWVKRIDAAASHNWADVIRGATNGLSSDTNGAAYTITGFNSFISTGFQLAADTTAQVNANGGRYASWNWKGGGTGVSNTTGSISSTVSANTDAGFSVVTYTGNGSTGTIGHGCKVNNVATAPSMIIIKVRSTTNDWGVGHASVGWSQAALLNLTNAFGASSYFNSTAPTSTVFSVGNNSVTNANGATYVAYCFAPVAGYSAFGSYTGNGSSDGPFVYVGFRPRYILFKNASAVSGWNIFDTARDTYNAADKYLGAQTSAAESSGTAVVDILSNGFKVRNSWTDVNGSGNTIVYAVFAESPFKYALAR